MKITTLSNTNILDVDADIIGHCCNCHNTMGSGVAASIREEYPEAYEEDCKTKKGDPTKLGTVSLCVVKDPTKHKNQNIKAIVNIYGQYDFGGTTRGASKISRPLDYEAIYCGLEMFKNKLKPAVKKIAFPEKMGCDRAGGNWEIVSKMIEVVFKDTDVEIIICQFTPLPKPNPLID